MPSRKTDIEREPKVHKGKTRGGGENRYGHGSKGSNGSGLVRGNRLFTEGGDRPTTGRPKSQGCKEGKRIARNRREKPKLVGLRPSMGRPAPQEKRGYAAVKN